MAAIETGTVERDERHMPFDAQRLWRQVALGEDTELELKEARFRADRVVGPKRGDLADGLAALANGRGGRLVLGVTDERQPQGLDPAQLDALADLVTEICSDSVVRWSWRCPRARRCIGLLVGISAAGETGNA